MARAIPNLSDIINGHIQRLDDKSNRLKLSMEYLIKNKQNQFVNLKNLLKSYSYQAVLERGFSLVQDNEGKIVSSIAVANLLPKMMIVFGDGQVSVVPEERDFVQDKLEVMKKNNLKNKEKNKNSKYRIDIKQRDLFDKE
ncbi:MAG: hypothetical protein IJV75_01630 [Alphaproteobacteria bacterium]|nr:hypothetical protein [Alphaproteobacteria bacterium]